MKFLGSGRNEDQLFVHSLVSHSPNSIQTVCFPKQTHFSHEDGGSVLLRNIEIYLEEIGFFHSLRKVLHLLGIKSPPSSLLGCFIGRDVPSHPKVWFGNNEIIFYLLYALNEPHLSPLYLSAFQSPFKFGLDVTFNSVTEVPSISQ